MTASSQLVIYMKFSRTIAYAIQATVQIACAEPSVPVKSKELAARANISTRYLLQILRHLVSHGILRSTKGAAGGYYLARSPEDITVLDILETFSKSRVPSVADFTALSIHARIRPLRSFEKTSDAQRNELGKLTLANLAQDSSEDVKAWPH